MTEDTESPDVEVFATAYCGWAQRNYAALSEKGVGFNLIPAKDARNEMTSAFLSSTPLAKTPVLRHGSAIVWESTLINEYIDEAFAGRHLLTDDAGVRAAARYRIHYCDNVLSPTVGRLVKSGEEPNKDDLAAFDYLNHAEFFPISGGDFWGGTDLSLVDLAYMTFFQSVEFAEKQGVEIRKHLPLRVDNWAHSIEEHPNVARAVKLANDFRQKPRCISVRPS